MKRTCPTCGRAPIGMTQRYCTTCKTALAKYSEQNPAIVAAYVSLGIAELERCLELHAAFDLYLLERKP